MSGGPGHPIPAAATHLDGCPAHAPNCGRLGLQWHPTNLSAFLPFPPRVFSQFFLGLKFSKFLELTLVTLVSNLSPEPSDFWAL